MKVTPTALAEVLLIEPAVFSDARGAFHELWSAQRYAEAGMATTFVQDNVSVSVKDVLRGLHIQHPFGQGKLVSVLEGAVFDVAVDVRRGSPTFAQWVGQELSAQNHRQLYIPPGFAHGFCVLGPRAQVAYKCTEYYRPQAERSVAYNDPRIGIAWPCEQPLLSAKDAQAVTLDQLPDDALPRYG